MILYLHIGIYKTGSSFLQTVCARGSSHLKVNNVYFAKSLNDERMLSGKISSGNSDHLAQLLIAKKYLEVKSLIARWFKEAETKGVGSVLISDESLIHSFAIRDILQEFEKIVSNAGFETVKCLVFFRNPLDHCMSTFKHRAKRGTIPDFKYWIEHKYETMGVIENFLDSIKGSTFKWSFRKYSADGSKMGKVFFTEWLMIQEPEVNFKISVNKSLTLSELKFIRKVYQVKKRWVPYLYDGFISLSKSDKFNDFELQKNYKSIAVNHLSKSLNVVENLNHHLPEGEELFLECPIEGISDGSLNQSYFSDKQLEIMALEIARANTFRNRILDFFRTIYRGVKSNFRA